MKLYQSDRAVDRLRENKTQYTAGKKFSRESRRVVTERLIRRNTTIVRTCKRLGSCGEETRETPDTI